MKISGAAEALISEIRARLRYKPRLLIAIDGRCASGKTTLAKALQSECECNVIHMDHFFLRPEQRTSARLSEPGGNVDYERFLEEALLPLERGETFSYRPYDCQTQRLAEAIRVEPRPVTIIEGAYCCHPRFIDKYDLRVFMTVDSQEQLLRIRSRNGEAGLARFKELWIPLEERYFEAYRIQEKCEICFNADSLRPLP